MSISCFSDAYGEFTYQVYSSIDNPNEFNFSYSLSTTEASVVGPGGFCSVESAIDAAKEAMDKDSRADLGQFDIVCEGHTENGMKFQIVTDNQNKDKGYGFAVDIWTCFENDYTVYRWGYPTLHSVFEEIESTEPVGTVVEQSIVEGIEVDINTQIILKVSKGMPSTGGDTITPTPEPDNSVAIVIPLTFEQPPETDCALLIWKGSELVVEQAVYAGTVSVEVKLYGEGLETFTAQLDGDASEHWTFQVDFSDDDLGV